MLPWKQGRHRRALRPGTWAHIQGSPLPRTVPRPHALSQLCLQDFAYEELTRTLKAPLIRRLRGPLRTGKGVCLETFIQSKHSKNYYDCPVSMATLIYNELHGYGGFTEPPGLDGGKHTPTSEEAAPALPQGPRRAGRRPLGADPRGPLRGAPPTQGPGQGCSVSAAETPRGLSSCWRHSAFGSTGLIVPSKSRDPPAKPSEDVLGSPTVTRHDVPAVSSHSFQVPSHPSRASSIPPAGP